MQRETIGVIGVGNIGQPMAERLLSKGFEVWVNDVREEPVARLEKLGAKRALSPREIGAQCKVIIIMVRNGAQAEEVILGRNGILGTLRKGALILAMCTVGPDFFRKVSKRIAGKGIGLLDAPVSGQAAGAQNGTLTIMVGGDKRLQRKCAPILEAMGKKIFHVGGLGTGQLVKLANNLTNYANQLSAAEAVALATKGGVKLKQLIEIISASSGDNLAIRNWQALQHRKISKGEHIQVMYKTMRVQKATAEELGLRLPLLDFMSGLDFMAHFKGTAFRPRKNVKVVKRKQAT